MSMRSECRQGICRTMNKTHLSLAVCGHASCGKSLIFGRLLLELGGVSEQVKKLFFRFDGDHKQNLSRDCADVLEIAAMKWNAPRNWNRDYVDRELFTTNYHYTIVDLPGQRHYTRNTIRGMAHGNVGLLVVSADNEFSVSMARGDLKPREYEGQARAHARLLNVFGFEKLVVVVTKMDSDKALYKQSRFEEIKVEVQTMLVEVGWKQSFVEQCVPFIPVSGTYCDNLFMSSVNMPWWQGVSVHRRPSCPAVLVVSLLDALDKFITPSRASLNQHLPLIHTLQGCMLRRMHHQLPSVLVNIIINFVGSPFRMTVSRYFKVRGTGDVVAGCVVQGSIQRYQHVKLIIAGEGPWGCRGRTMSIEMYHKETQDSGPGSNIGLWVIRGFERGHLPRVGDCVVLQTDSSLSTCTSFTALVQVNRKIKIGYSPIAYVQMGRSKCKIIALNWKMNEDGSKLFGPPFLIAGDTAEITFVPLFPFVCDTFSRCEGLGRVAMLDGHSFVLGGKIMDVVFKPSG